MDPLISVIIPTFNRADFVHRTIDSVLTQKYTNFEILLIDDGSTDHTQDIVRSISDDRFRYHRQANQGRCIARNVGAQLSCGSWLTFVDSDDEATPDWLEEMRHFTEFADTGVICCGLYVKDLKGNVKVRLPVRLGPHYDNQVGCFLAGCFAVRREIFHEIGGYFPHLDYSENSDLGIRLTSYCKEAGWRVRSVLKPLILYHQQPNRSARNPETFQRRLESARYFLRVHGHRYLPESPDGYANYCAIAGVNAARLGLMRDARSYFLKAVRTYPWNWRHILRLLLACFPRIASRYWLRYVESGEDR